MSETLQLTDYLKTGDPPVCVMHSHHTAMKRHDHNFYELVYVREGYCLHSVSNLSTLIMEGDVFILCPGIAHTYAGNRVTRIFNCLFQKDALYGDADALCALDGLFCEETGFSRQIHLTLSEREQLLGILTEMDDLNSAPSEEKRILLPALLSDLLKAYASAHCARREGSTAGSVYPTYVRPALAVIDAQYSDASLTVHDIAAQVGVSEDYLSRQFRAITGIATRQYLRRYRFARAMELLQAGHSVSDVAQAVGFQRLSYFSREFTRELGITPSKYREKTNPTLNINREDTSWH